jgi:hypothetical protein
MVTRVVATLLAASTVLWAKPASAEDFWMLFQNHHVTLIARDMTASRILDRWAQIGGTEVVNGAAVQGGPVSLQLTDVSEREALEILLRGTDGYMIAERDDAAAGLSSIGKILILPKSAVRNQSPLNAATFDRPDYSQPTGVQAEQAFVPTTPDVVQTTPPPPSPDYVPPGSVPIPVLRSGTARPGEVTAPIPALFKPGTTPTGQPGQVPPLDRTIIVTGPGAIPPEAR